MLLAALLLAGPASAQQGDAIEHKVVDGDTLIALAQRYLMDPTQWVAIHKANPSIKDVRRLQPGSIILIPGLPPGPVAIHVSGKARYTRMGNARELAKGDELRETDTVDVEAGSYVTLRWPEGIVTHLLPGASLRLLPPPPPKRGKEKDPRPRPRVIELQQGTVESAVPAGTEGRSYQIRTRLGTAAVRGTQFGVRLPSGGAMVTEVTEGTVQLAGSGFQPVDLPPGTGAVADGSQRQPQAVPMLKAPALEEDPAVTPESGFEAGAVEGAAKYEFEIAPAADPLAIRRVEGATPVFALRPIRDGSYRTRIRAVDAQGIPGLVTARTLTVMSLAAPFLNEPENDAVLGQDVETRMLCTDIPGATHYEIDIRRPGAKEEAVKLMVAGSCDTRMPMLLVGKYEWRAYTLRQLPNGKMLRSGPSAAGRFSIVVRPPTPALKVGGGQGLSLRWEGSPDASYIVQLASDEEFKQVISETKVDLPEVTLDVPTGGAYFVRIRTLSGSVASDFTPPRIVRGPAFVGSSDGQPVRDSFGTPLGPPPP